ncbi:TPA: hypothetical protein ACXG3C_004473, partial [Klebsiella pneumoniae]
KLNSRITNQGNYPFNFRMACVECQKQWYRDNGKHKPDPDIKPFSSAYTIAAVFFKGIRL